MLKCISDLIHEPHDYKTLVLDTADGYEPMVLDYVCRDARMEDDRDASFGKGFVAADDEWRRFIRGVTALRDKRGMTIIIVCHAEIVTQNDPRAPSYTSYCRNFTSAPAPSLWTLATASSFWAMTCVSSPTATSGFVQAQARRDTYSPRAHQRSRRRTDTGFRRRCRFRSTSTSPTSPSTGRGEGEIWRPSDCTSPTLSTDYWENHMSQSSYLETAFETDKEEGTPAIELLPMDRYTAEISQATAGADQERQGLCRQPGCGASAKASTRGGRCFRRACCSTTTRTS